MTTMELLALDISELQKAKYNAVKKEAILTLQSIILLLEKNDIKSIFDKLHYSPSGDGYGSDNYYIGFDTIGAEYDISQVVEVLLSLKEGQF